MFKIIGDRIIGIIMESIEELEKKTNGFEIIANESFNKHKYELALPFLF